jgi:DNA-directed RNA polymerase specialized sigma24 family protein
MRAASTIRAMCRSTRRRSRNTRFPSPRKRRSSSATSSAFWPLGEDHREVLMLVGASGFSYEEAAKICNCAVGTIKSRVSRVRHELTRLLSEDAPKVSRRTPLVGISPQEARR